MADGFDVDIDEVRAYIIRPVWQLFRVSLPARVTSFVRDTARVAGDIAVRFMDTTRAYRDEQPVADVPVVFPGGDGYGLYHDLAAGDPVVLLAGDAEQRPFWEDGSTATPSTGQRHSYGCAVAFAGGRVSSSTPGQATPAPNAAGECLLGARDGTAGLRLRRARPDAAPPEAGTAVVEAAAPVAAVRLGSDAATLGVGRLTDPVAPTVDMAAFITAIASFANNAVPGTVPPNVLLALTGPAAQIGVISGASERVVSD